MDGFDSVRLLADNDAETFLEAAKILNRIIDNILKDPENDKYRKMKIANPTLSTKLLPVDGAFQFLFEMGFEEADDFLILPQSVSLDRIRGIQKALNCQRDKIQTSHSGSTSVAARPTATAASSANVRIPSGAANTQTSAALPSGAALFQSEARFFKKLRASLDLVTSYEDPRLQQKARSCIPVDLLTERAKERLAVLGQGPDSPDARDLLLLELLAWFKKDFFRWVNQPECARCGGATVGTGMAQPTDEELRFGAGRVESYRCQTCGFSGTRFPRYNDPGKLLETRRGRCGEWANCFTLCCRVLDFEARYVLDWTDHVWTEVFSPRQDRWLHCDPCENSCDKPLTYEVGWNKKLTYVVAFARDDIQDVTWRYSRAHKDVLARRRDCRESWLLQTILKLRRQRQRDCPPVRAAEHLRRLVKELVEFLTVKSAVSAEEETGRVSGSAAWRSARGEIGESGAAAATVTIRPTAGEVAAGALHLRYSCAADRYERSGSGEYSSGWRSLVHAATNVFRKEEADWEKVYLARTEGSSEADISWKFDLTESGFVVDRIAITAESCVYESGQISWRVCSDDQCAVLPADGSPSVLDSLSGASVVTVTASLRGGKGDVAWQHTQLFRQGLREYTSYPLDIHIHLRKL